MRPLYIFDLDGTLALIEHRRHFVEGPKKDWPSFFKACVDDEPNYRVIETLKHLLDSGAEIWIWSGRSDEVVRETVVWLNRYLDTSDWELTMREAGDHQPDDTLKQSWLDRMQSGDRIRLVGVFEDRDRVVEMWRRNGITCFQVAPGNF